MGDMSPSLMCGYIPEIALKLSLKRSTYPVEFKGSSKHIPYRPTIYIDHRRMLSAE